MWVVQMAVEDLLRSGKRAVQSEAPVSLALWIRIKLEQRTADGLQQAMDRNSALYYRYI